MAVEEVCQEAMVAETEMLCRPENQVESLYLQQERHFRSHSIPYKLTIGTCEYLEVE